MSRRATDANDELVASLLVAYDEALATDGLRSEVESVIDDADIAARLREAKACVELLDRVRRLDGATVTPSAQRSQSQPHPISVGRFQIECELGRGGLGVVLLGRDPQVGRQVAIKTPRPDLIASDEHERRFLREAEAASRLNHPRLVTLLEVGRDGPHCYLVMEYCAGPSLAEWLKLYPGPSPPRHAALLVQQLAEAVHHAHSRGVLHRDVKPSNVLLELADHSGAVTDEDLRRWSPKLTDFGMAKLLESRGDQTRTGTVLGTPTYMAPEQADGRTRDIDARTDVYALGAVLYELLTGSPPYRGASDVDTLRQLLMEEPTAPRRLSPAIPRDLDAIALKCLAKQASARYPTAQHLAEDLTRFLDGAPTVARPASSVGRWWKWARRRPVAATSVGIVAAALVAVFGVIVSYSARLTDEVARTERESESNRRLLYAAEVRLAQGAYQANNVVQMLELLDHHTPKPGQEDLREFAWHYLFGLAHQELVTLVGHKDEVSCVAYSRDGRLLATASMDGTVRLWETATGHELQVLSGGARYAACLAFSPDGRFLASGGEDSALWLWETETGEQRGRFEGHTQDVLSIAFSPDGLLLASGARDATVRVWDVNSQLLTRHILDDDPIGNVTAIGFSADGSLLVAGDDKGNVHCWETEDWKRLWVENNGDRFVALACSESRPLLAGVEGETSIRLYAYTKDGIHGLQHFDHRHAGPVQGLAFSPRNGMLASCGKDGAIQLWSIDEPGPPHTILGHTTCVRRIAWSPDGRFLASAGADGVVKLWAAGNLPDTNALPGVEHGIESIDVARNGETLVAGCFDGSLLVWNLIERSVRAKRRFFHGEIFCVRISPDGLRIGIAGAPDTVKIVNAQTLEVERGFWWQKSKRNALTWSPDGSRLLACAADGAVRLVDAGTGKTVVELSLDTPAHDCDFSPDGKQIAVAAGHLRLFDAQTGELQYTLDEANLAAFSPDNRLLVSSRGSVVTLRDARTLQKLGTFVGRPEPISILRFSPSGRTLATGHKSATIILWDVRTGQELFPLTCDGGNMLTLEDLAFTWSEDHLFAVGRESSGSSNRKGGRIWDWSALTNTRPARDDSAPRPLSRPDFPIAR